MENPVFAGEKCLLAAGSYAVRATLSEEQIFSSLTRNLNLSSEPLYDWHSEVGGFFSVKKSVLSKIANCSGRWSCELSCIIFEYTLICSKVNKPWKKAFRQATLPNVLSFLPVGITRKNLDSHWNERLFTFHNALAVWRGYDYPECNIILSSQVSDTYDAS